MASESKNSLEILIEYLKKNITSSGAGDETLTRAIDTLKTQAKTVRDLHLLRTSEKLLELDKEFFKAENKLNPLANPLGQLQIYTILSFLSESLSKECDIEIKILNDAFTKKIEKINSILNLK
jgi:hypothetical protein